MADRVILADIYAARETDTLGISSRDIAERIEKLEQKSGIFRHFLKLKNFLKPTASQGIC